MNQKKIQLILQELYEIDSSLKQHEKKLKVLLEKIIASEPEVEIDERFVAKLRNDILSKEMGGSNVLNFLSMNKLPFAMAGVVATFAIVIVVSYGIVGQKLNKNNLVYKVGQSEMSDMDVTRLSANAFGDLGSAGSDFFPSPAPAGATLGLESAVSSDERFAKGIGGGGGGGGVSMQSQAIAPIYEPEYMYEVKYIGDSISFDYNEAPIYKLVFDTSLGKKIANSVMGHDLGFMDFDKMKDSFVQNIHITSKDEGRYSLYLDLERNKASLSRVQEYFYGMIEPGCFGPDCGVSAQIKEVDDSVLINTANKFLSDFGINTSNYGSPVVDDSWKIYQDERYFSVPQMQTVIYPIAFDGDNVYDLGGMEYGMRVIVNVKDMVVYSVQEITNPVFESSNYEIETNFDKIVKIAEEGGINRTFYGAKQEGEVLEIGNPESITIHHYIFDEETRKSSELFIPALKFPIVSDIEGKRIYQDSVIVPLVKDILDMYDRRSKPEPYIQPIEPRVEIMEGSTSGSSGAYDEDAPEVQAIEE
jgi:hypothetical protein